MKKAQILFFVIFFLSLPLIKIGYADTVAAPDFTLGDMNGQDFTLSDFKGKQKVLLFFWATWCFHCRQALKEINQKKSDYKIVTINIGEPKDRVKEFLAKNNYDVYTLLDEKNKVAFSYFIFAVPTFVLIDKDLTIEYMDHVFPPDLD
ncbi:MAG: TlpA family protein disulfide reductase [Candidatus Omnitrophica bacterium]|nr:TlpA family protein disulfide reductase [Candidatus Omnitrophota bacterium]